MKKLLLIILWFILVLIGISLGAFIASGANGLSGKTVIDHDKNTIVHNESVEFGVKTTVTVPESDCVKCLRQFSCDECKVFTCEDVNCNN